MRVILLTMKNQNCPGWDNNHYFNLFEKFKNKNCPSCGSKITVNIPKNIKYLYYEKYVNIFNYSKSNGSLGKISI